MNFHAPATARPYEAIHGGTYTAKCAVCEGAGRNYESRNYAGEAYGELVDTGPCEACGGDSEWLACDFCDKPVVGNTCDGCESLFLDLPVTDLGNGRFGVRSR